MHTHAHIHTYMRAHGGQTHDIKSNTATLIDINVHYQIFKNRKITKLNAYGIL